MDHFVVRFEHGDRKEDMVALYHLADVCGQKLPQDCRETALFFLGLALMIPSAFAVIVLNNTGLLVFLGFGVGLVALLVSCATRLWGDRFMGWALTRNGLASGPTTIQFQDDAIITTSALGSSRLSYDKIFASCRYQGRFFLLLDQRHSIILPDDCFVTGDSAEFRRFIQEKTNKLVLNVR